jgi:hypothetical protein
VEKGYIKLFRCIQDRPEWLRKPFDPERAWIDLLLLTNYSDGGYEIRGIWVEVKRGECGWSQVKLAERWGWSRDKVRRWLARCESDGQTARRTIQHNKYLTSVIILLNYELYQGDDTADKTANNTADRQQTDSRQGKNKKGKKEKKVKKDIYGEFQNVKLLKAEHEKLVKGYGQKVTGEMIERLSQYVESSGKIYKSHYATILGWLRKDGIDPLRECKATDPMPVNVQNRTAWSHPDLVEVKERVDGALTGKIAKKCQNCDLIFGG